MSPGETGLHTLMDSGQIAADVPNVEIPDWENLIGMIELLTTSAHSRKTLVIDTINGMEKIGNAYVCGKDYGGDVASNTGFMSYQGGYRAFAMGEYRRLLCALDALRSAKQMQIVLLAHTGVVNQKNPLGQDYNRFTPAFDGKYAWEATFAWADIVLFADFDVVVTKEKGESKAKGKGGSRRYFRTNWEPGFDAKNRHGLSEEIEMGDSGQSAWDALDLEINRNHQPAEETK